MLIIEGKWTGELNIVVKIFDEPTILLKEDVEKLISNPPDERKVVTDILMKSIKEYGSYLMPKQVLLYSLRSHGYYLMSVATLQNYKVKVSDAI